MAVCAAGNNGVGPGVKRRFLCSIVRVLYEKEIALKFTGIERRVPHFSHVGNGSIRNPSQLDVILSPATAGRGTVGPADDLDAVDGTARASCSESVPRSSSSTARVS